MELNTQKKKQKFRHTGVSFWKNILKEAAEVDYGMTVPKIDDKFLNIWAAHYHRIGTMADIDTGFLEIGAGFGVLAAGISRISGKPGFCVEHPTRSYFYSRSYLEFLESHSLSIIGCDLRRGLPYKDSTFQKVFFCDVIEHLFFNDIKTLLNDIYRVLKPGGQVVISTPNLNRLSNFIRIIKGFSPNPPLYPQSCGETFGHIREFAPAELNQLLKRHSFKPVKMSFCLNPYFTAEAFGDDNIFSPRGSARINAITRFFFRFLPFLGDEIYLLAEK